MKKIISTLLSLAIIIGTLPMIVMAESADGWNGTDVATAYAGGDGSARRVRLRAFAPAAELRSWEEQLPVNGCKSEKRYIQSI